MLSLAEIEFCLLMIQGNYNPSLIFGLGTLWLTLLNAQFPDWKLLEPGLALILLMSLVWQMKHRQHTPVADWALTIIGGLYLGTCGASMIKLRYLDDGFWWILMVISAATFADSASYFAGRAWGKHKMTPSLSPGKTWEGYIAGVLVGTLAPVLVTLLWYTLEKRTAAPWIYSLVLGLLITTLAPLGDLAISMIKRQVGAKDSGKILPGHGGALDRIDSITWAAVIGYYYTLWLVT
jgi:phosphatidate cytidylyltransferase